MFGCYDRRLDDVEMRSKLPQSYEPWPAGPVATGRGRGALNGYSMHSGLSPAATRRDDRQGGSRGNDMRFQLEVAAAARAVWPSTKALAFPSCGRGPCSPARSEVSGIGS